MQAIFNVCIYASLIFLALSCAIVANSMDMNTCRCKKTLLISVMTGCVSLTLCVFYGLGINYILASLLPINIGIALWFILDRRQAHDEIERFIEQFKLIFNW